MDNIEQIKSRINIVDLLREYIELKKAGANWKALCPFHSEKTPSLMVSEDKQIWHCFGCFPPGQKIKTPFGLHNIEIIDTNHYVYSGRGQIRKVLAIHRRDYKGELINIRVRKLSGEAVSLTNDHKLKTIRPKTKHYRATKQFYRRCRDAVRANRVNNISEAIEKYGDFLEITAGELKKDDFVLYPINTNVTDMQELNLRDYLFKKYTFGPYVKQIPYKIKISEDILKLFGYWIAEGSGHRAYIRFSLGNHEENFAKEIVHLIKQVFGLRAKIHKRRGKNKTGIEITACHSYLADIFENICGKGAQNKHIPFVFQELPPEKQKILVDAIFKGDGHEFVANRSAKKHKSVTTISRILAEQIIDILLRNNVYPTFTITKEKVDKPGVNHREAFTVYWSEEAKAQHNFIYQDIDGIKYWLLPIKKIYKEQYAGPVYNLTVDNDHSYVATNFAVANCNEGGDIFGFVMKMEGVDFPEALRLLAKKAGVELVHRDPAQNSQKTKLMDILEAAAGFYSGELIKSPVAFEYIKKRELNDEIVKKFRLGFAPQSWDSLLKFLQTKNFGLRDIALAGLLIEKAESRSELRSTTGNGGGFYDRFRGRVMFPIFNHYGNIVGFTARVLPQFDDGKSGKYINTPETAAYKKSEVLYGLNFAKQEIKKEGRVVVVEGNMDVIALHQAGFKNVVATSGTALTNEQLGLLKRFTENMIVCFDADSAGIQAALRGIDLALAHGFNVKVFGMPKNENGEPVAKDPDELIKKFPELWKKAISSPKHIIEFYIAANVAKFNLGDPHEAAAFCKIILNEISKIKNSVERSLWIKKLAAVSGVDERDLREMILSPRAMNRESAIVAAESSAEPPIGLKYLALVLTDAKKFLSAFKDVLPEMMGSAETQEFYRDTLFYYNENKEFSLQGFRDFLGNAGKNPLFLDKLAMLKDKDYTGADDEEIEREIKNLSLRLKNNYFKEQRKILEQEMILAERDGDKEKIDVLMEKFKALNF